MSTTELMYFSDPAKER